MKVLLLGLTIIALGVSSTHKPISPDTSKISLQNNDTISVGYSYWWPYSGPFLFPREESVALVFYGKIVRVGPPMEDSNLLYISQTGVVKIEEIYHRKDVERWNYKNQSYFKSDCFYGMDLKPGDPVLVSCYEYEKSYAIPGVKSVLPLKDGDQKVLQSINKYFKGKYKNLLRDSTIWEQYELKNQFKNAVNYKIKAEN